MSRTYRFDEAARLPEQGDNVAVAVRRLEAGLSIQRGDTRLRLDHTVMEGHRFAVRPIGTGQPLLSWGLPFGRTVRPIEPGAYVCNQGMLEALQERELDFELPAEPNFEDVVQPCPFDASRFRPGKQVEGCNRIPLFQGYERPGRGIGTRNYIALVGTSSRTGSFVRRLAERLQEAAAGFDRVDGVVAVEHTEGGGRERPNNLELVLRALAGFAVHPNVGAVLAVDYGTESVTNRMLRKYMEERGYPLDLIPHRFESLSGTFEAHLEQGERQVREWLPRVNEARRTQQPVSRLKIALQCGGSDAFSGISGNPLAGWVARELIRCGGAANLAETDELIGAESYLLQNVRDPATARRFLEMIERFKERAAWHGESAEGNPSGGNRYRGLYNITLKSIGAARKRDPEVRLDYCIEYAEPMEKPGFYFMDSPGNDLESIAGQVASGCNLILFVTGNGSVTNFPFVPTLKIVTTTARYEQLAGEMDINAGAYLDGVSLEVLGRRTFEQVVEVAGGVPSKGERAGGAQVQLWRNWPRGDGKKAAVIQRRPSPGGKALPVQEEKGPERRLSLWRTDRGYAIDRVGLVLPTSLCSAQIARMAADRLNARAVGKEKGISRFVSLVHTEGCGGTGEEILTRTLLGYLTHPLVGAALFLEHGCEKTHNEYMRNRLRERGLYPGEFGWASVQADGGVASVLDRVEKWFSEIVERMAPSIREEVGLEELEVGLLSAGGADRRIVRALAALTRWIVSAGGSVVVPENASLLATPEYWKGVLRGRPTGPSLAYGERMKEKGFHVMETPTGHWVETATGLGATGVEIVLAHVSEHPVQGHPLLPLVQVSSDEEVRRRHGADLDLALSEGAEAWATQILDLLVDVAGQRHIPRATALGNTAFQLTRGLLGISL